MFLRIRYDRFVYTAGEIGLALEYSEMGSYRSLREQQGFVVVEMAGPSDDAKFSALRDLLFGLEMGIGSFAVLRYGGRGEERVIEL